MELVGTRDACPCGSGESYGGCCLPLHEGRAASTAEGLMRSRYSAYALGLEDHVFRTWHPRTRPSDLQLDRDITWTGLRVLATQDGGPDDETGVVEFEATWSRQARPPGVLHEVSRFSRRGGRWVYLDASP